ncbi:MAG: sel1 repeat family protein [Rhodocyclaceae bacterium]|nr:sel1 repeat family protein [Rhodocyclaceae bacterium]
MARALGRQAHAGLILFVVSVALACAAEPGAPERWRRAQLAGGCAQAVIEVSRLAAEGDATAMQQLSDWRYFGACLPKDDALSAEWARRAAEAGSDVAMAALGQLYWHGQGVPADRDQARFWLGRAADAGLAPAMVLLSRFLYEHGGEPALVLAWARRAAALGHAPAYAWLAELYARGVAGRVDFAEAYVWSARALATAPTAQTGDGNQMAALQLTRAWAALHLGRHDDAVVACDAVPAHAPEYPAAQLYKAHALLLNGQTGNALDLYAANRVLRGAEAFTAALRADFAALRASGIDHPGMRRVEQRLLPGG